MTHKKAETVIIGAGPAGLAAAMELARNKKDFLVIEKQNQVGGLAATHTFRETDAAGAPLLFRTDNGPHRFFSADRRLYDFIADMLREQWIQVKRQTRQYIDGKFYEYPINPAQALAHIGPARAARIIFDYVASRIQYGVLKKPIKNFEEYVVAHFGRSLGNFNMINYTEKIWGVPAATIHTDWAEQRIRGLSVGFLIQAAVRQAIAGARVEQPRTLVDFFYYPEYGTGLLYETMRRRLEQQKYAILRNAYPIKIKHRGNRIQEISIKGHNTEFSVSPEHLIESMPLKEFMHMLDPAPPPEVLAAADKMNYRDQVYLFITLDKERVTDNQWIYFPEKHIPFGRISEMKNFSAKMSPPGKTSLLVEFFCFENDALWNKSADDLFALTMAYVEPLGFCKKSEVRKYYHIRQKKVYPIYDLKYKEYLAAVKQYADQFENLYYIGRPGRFRYNNQDHSLEMGFAAAKSIIHGARYDIDGIGAGTDYLEKGHWQKS